MSPNLERLPDDVLLNIISFVPYKDANCLCRVSKRLRELCEQQLKSRVVLVDSSEKGFNFTQRAYKRTAFDCNVAINVRYEKLLELFVTRLPNIKTLCLHEVEGINDANIRLIGQRLPNLNYLWLHRLYRHLTDRGLSRLFPLCGNLQKLALHFLDINGSCFRQIPPVKWLSIASHWNLDTDSYYRLCSRLSNTLETFCFDNPDGAEIHSNLLRQIPKLRAVEITIHKSADFVPCLSVISAHSKIDELSLNTIAEVNGEKLSTIPSFENISSASLMFDSHVSDDDLVKIVEKFPNVKHLSLHISDEGYYSSVYTADDPSKVFPEYSKTVELIKDLQRLESVSVFFDKSSKFETRVDKFCKSLFDCTSIKRLKLGCLNEEELHAIISSLRKLFAEEREKRMEVDLYTFTKEINLGCNFMNTVRVYKQQDKEEREKSYYTTSKR